MTRKTSRWRWFLIAGIPLAALLLSYHDYWLSSPGIDVVDMPEMKVLYVDYTGRYQDAADAFLPFMDMAKANRVECRHIWAQYMDYPFLVDGDKLRGRLGCVVDDVPGGLPANVHVITVPPRSYVRARRNGDSVMLVYRLHLLMNLYAVRHQLFLAGYLVDFYDPLADAPHHATLLIPVSAEAGQD